MVSFFQRVKTLFARDKKREMPIILTEADYLAMHVIELPGLEPTRSKKTLRRHEYEYYNTNRPLELVPIFPGVSILCCCRSRYDLAYYCALSVYVLICMDISMACVNTEP